MVEISGIILLSSVLWVITGLSVLASLISEDGVDQKMFGAVGIILGSITFILTLIGTGVIEVI